MNEIVGFSGGQSGLSESSDSGHLAFASALDSVVAQAHYILGLESEKSPVSRGAAI